MVIGRVTIGGDVWVIHLGHIRVYFDLASFIVFPLAPNMESSEYISSDEWQIILEDYEEQMAKFNLLGTPCVTGLVSDILSLN